MYHLNIINYILYYLIIKIINHYFLINVTINNLYNDLISSDVITTQQREKQNFSLVS